jgi:hypothetical protein
MSNAASNHVEDKTLDFWLKANSAATSAPSTVYVALFYGTAASVLANLEAGTITDEITLGSYARQSVTFGTVSGGSVSNSANVTFPTATANYDGDVTCLAIMDASTSGNVLFAGELTVSKTVTTGDQFQIASGNLTVSLT